MRFDWDSVRESILDCGEPQRRARRNTKTIEYLMFRINGTQCRMNGYLMLILW